MDLLYIQPWLGPSPNISRRVGKSKACVPWRCVGKVSSPLFVGEVGGYCSRAVMGAPASQRYRLDACLLLAGGRNVVLNVGRQECGSECGSERGSEVTVLGLCSGTSPHNKTAKVDECGWSATNIMHIRAMY